jgi:hypothetical protein
MWFFAVEITREISRQVLVSISRYPQISGVGVTKFNQFGFIKGQPIHLDRDPILTPNGHKSVFFRLIPVDQQHKLSPF